MENKELENKNSLQNNFHLTEISEDEMSKIQGGDLLGAIGAWLHDHFCDTHRERAWPGTVDYTNYGKTFKVYC
jgi:hypothetical protein